MVHIAVNGNEVRATCGTHRKKCVTIVKNTQNACGSVILKNLELRTNLNFFNAHKSEITKEMLTTCINRDVTIQKSANVYIV